MTYNGIWLKGKPVKQGYRPSENRYFQIENFCNNYKRPFSVLDLGAAEGYFTFRLAEKFDGAFAAVEHDKGRNILNLCKENNNEKVMLLHKKMNLHDLKKIAEVHYFDVILALNIIHHFNEPFQEVLDVLMSMCSYCFFEHPDEKEDKKTINFQRLSKEKLNLKKYNGKFLTDTNRWQSVDRKMYLLENLNIKKIKRCWSNGPHYKAGKEIIINTSFESVAVEYQSRQENRPWLLGMNLRTFLESGGSYPDENNILQMINKIEIKGSKIDLAPHNIIIGKNKLHLIDQDDHTDPICHSKESLKSYLTKNFFQFR